MKKIIIAIDGQSSTGKSTLAKQLGNELKYSYISTGDMYRAVTLYCIENHVDIANETAIETALTNIRLYFKNDGHGTHIFLNDRDVQSEIKKMYVSEMVSPVAKISTVRRAMVAEQRLLALSKGVVMDGRDIGTVVFPNAELKIYLTASSEERARRRYEELKAKGQQIDLKEVAKNLAERDHIDSTRADSPLKKADDAKILDNTHLTLSEQLQIAKGWVQEILK